MDVSLTVERQILTDTEQQKVENYRHFYHNNCKQHCKEIVKVLKINNTRIVTIPVKAARNIEETQCLKLLMASSNI